MPSTGPLASHLNQPRTLSWGRCVENQWCLLPNLNLDHPHFTGMEGVYVIWHGGSQPRTLYVGQGSIADRLRQHRNEPKFTAYLYHGLFVTWASVDKRAMAGVERYLIDTLRPVLNNQVPRADSIPVVLPWSS